MVAPQGGVQGLGNAGDRAGHAVDPEHDAAVVVLVGFGVDDLGEDAAQRRVPAGHDVMLGIEGIERVPALMALVSG